MYGAIAGFTVLKDLEGKGLRRSDCGKIGLSTRVLTTLDVLGRSFPFLPSLVTGSDSGEHPQIDAEEEGALSTALLILLLCHRTWNLRHEAKFFSVLECLLSSEVYVNEHGNSNYHLALCAGLEAQFYLIPFQLLIKRDRDASMDSTHAENRRPGRENARKGFAEDDINIPYRGMLQSARRLQETRELLASPGPLESMLRTTTETGDIGLYSVRPSRSSSRARTPLHPAATLAGSELARTTSMNAPERRHFRDGRRGPPAQRDATSEIVALYGPNRLRSTPASFSRSPDDPAPRSYSLTSCSSRYMSDQKSTGTWDSRSSGGSGGGLPRPRSPYPYHTRLKRPGVRPSSPALTLDGGVDYSRMVEIDRPSYVSHVVWD